MEERPFALPEGGRVETWEAAKAESSGWEIVSRGQAEEPGYADSAPGAAGATLAFRFHTDRPTCLKLFPLWWRHGDQRSATRFPATEPAFTVQQVAAMAYPDLQGLTKLPLAVTQRPGPDVLGRFENHLFFTAPEAGRVGVVDLQTECLVETIEVGGYPADLVVGPDAGRVYVADAAGDRVLALDARTRRVVAEVSVPAHPRSLALSHGRLFVASLGARTLMTLDAATLEVLHRRALPVAPHHVAVQGDRVRVWALPGAYDPATGEEREPDRLAYFPLHPFPQGPERPPLLWESLRAATGGRFARLVTHVDNWEEFHVQLPTALVALGPTPETLTVRWPNREPAEESVDIEAVVARPPKPPKVGGLEEPALLETPPSVGGLGGPALPETPPSVGGLGGPALPPELSDDAIPDRYGVAEKTLFFTAPAAGRVGFLPLHPPADVGSIEVGGYLADLAVFTGEVMGRYVDRCLSFFPSPAAGRAYSPDEGSYPARVYVADAANDRVVVIDPAARRVIREIPVGVMPVSLRLYGLELFAVCRKGREVVVIDVRTDEIARRIALSAEPVWAEVAKFQPPYTASEFRPPVEVDESPLRLVLHYQPLAFAASDLAPVEASAAAQTDASVLDAVLPPSRACLEWTSPDGTGREALADNFHLLRFDGSRWLDVSEVTDPKRAGEPARLGPRDRPGAVTLSLDDGPAHDWMRGVWLTPETRSFLVSGSEEFREWNAPAFRVEPGAHEIRVTAHGPHARLEGLLVWRSLESSLDVSLCPEPEDAHAPVPLPSYQGVFAADEPVRFALSLRARGDVPGALHVAWRVLHPVDDTELASGATDAAAGQASVEIAPELAATGLFVLEVRVSSPDGALTLRRHFLRLPRLEHPRLLCRAEELPEIRERIARTPLLFKRTREWMEWKHGEPGFLPADYHTTGQNLEVDLAKWRAVSCLFFDLAYPSPDGRQPFLQRIRRELKGTASAGWSSFQTDFQFGAALAILYDLACALDPEMRDVVGRELAPSLMQGRALPEALVQIEEPLTPQARAVLAWHAGELANYLRYFRAHTGEQGGMLWQGMRSDCQCSLHSTARTMLFWSIFLNDRKLLANRCWEGFYTYHNYALPRDDHDRFLSPGGVRGGGEHPEQGNAPMRYAVTSLLRHPLEKARNNLEAVLERLNGPAGFHEDRAARPTLGTDSYVVVPLFLALGWYDPDAPGADWNELPPSLLCDGDGAACLKSDWSATMTDVLFISGVRDVSYRTQPNHLQVFKAGRVLLGTPVHTIDHGIPTPSWANTVVLGEGIPAEWHDATGYARMDERAVVRRFAPEVLGYLVRDYRLSGMIPQTSAWFHGGHSGPGMYDLVLHSHTWHPYLSQGQIIAYQTTPAFDYVAGDATNVWPLDDAREVVRQVVFLRPDTLVVYDRVLLGANRPATRWIASTAPDLTVEGSAFTIANKEAWMKGLVLHPRDARVSAGGARRVGLRQEGGTLHQNLLEIAPAAHGEEAHYLVVMQTGTGPALPLHAEAVEAEGQVGARVRVGSVDTVVHFNTVGSVGGRVSLGGREHPLTERVETSLRAWEEDPRYPAWISDPRFRFFVRS